MAERPADVPAGRWPSGFSQSAMLPHFGLLYYLLGFTFFFRRLRMEDHSAERVRRAAARGPVVYALHTRSHVDLLALNRTLHDRRLPLSVFSNGLSTTRWRPLLELLRTTWDNLRGQSPDDPPSANPLSPNPSDSGWLARTIAGGDAVALFLTPGRDLGDLFGRSPEKTSLKAVLDAQARTERPIQVLPVVVIWNRSPEVRRSEVERFLLGSEDNPGPFGKLWDLAFSPGDAIVQVGEPVPVTELLGRTAGEPLERQEKVLRLLLRRYLYREARVVRGPRTRPWGEVRRNVLRSPEVVAMIGRESGAKTPEVFGRQVARTYDRMAARFSFPYVRFASRLLNVVWTRVFSGIDIRPEDLDRVRDALRNGTPILVPCHRSHLDYLLLSSVLFEHDIVIPHIVAGDNLSFWPLGAFFRRAGAFFIRRNFSGDRVFPVLFERYVTELVHLEVPVEFFIEGGRSRTGKLLPPKLGVFRMIVNAAERGRADRAVTFLPIYIGYEQIAEERVYARELGGAAKEKESVGGVMRATRVLGKRYGRVVVRVGTPLPAAEVMGGDWGNLRSEEQKGRLQAGALRLMQRINREAPALPTALLSSALLSHSRRGIRHEDLRGRFLRFFQHCERVGVPRGAGMSIPEAAMTEAIDRFVGRRFLEPVGEAGDGTLGDGAVYGVVPSRRVSLEYYKNSILHAFGSAALYASAVRGLGEDRLDVAEVSRLFRFQHHLLRYELLHDPDHTVENREEEAKHQLVAYGALSLAGVHLDGSTLAVAQRGLVAELANLVANLLESYLLVVRTLEGTRSRPGTPAEVTTRALQLGRSLLTVEELLRPEALSLQNLQHAVKALQEDGAARLRADGRLEGSTEVLAAIRKDLAVLLGDGPVR